MTADPQDLPSLPAPDYWRGFDRVEKMATFARESRAPLLAKIAEFTKHFDEVDREIDELEAMAEKVKGRAEAAEQERDELRAKLEAAQKDADEASANFYCERCGCSYCQEAEARHDAASAEKP